MSGDSAASSPGRTGARAGRSVGRKAGGSRWGRLLESGLLQGGVQGSPVLRLFMRWVRRPLLPVMRLWRRNIQLKVVVTTLLMSLGVVLLLGFVVIGQVRNGLLDAKVKASQSQATGGFAVAKQKADEAAAGTGDDGAPVDDHTEQNVVQWMSDLVESLSSGGQGAFDVVTLPAAGDDSGGGRGPRFSGDVDWAASVPEALRRASTATRRRPRATRGSLRRHSRQGLPAGADHRQAGQRPERRPVPAVLPLPAHPGGEVAQPGQGHPGDGRALRRRTARGHRLAGGAAGRHAGADGRRDRGAAVRRAAAGADEGHR